MNFKTLAIAAALAASSAVAMAAPDIDALNNSVTVYSGAQHVNYRETMSGSVLDSENGSQPDVGVRIRAQGFGSYAHPLFVELDLQRARGTTDYTGSLQDGTPYSQTGGTSNTLDQRVRIGFAAARDGSVQVTPFAAFARHSWTRGDDVAPDYREHYSQNGLGLGAMFQIKMIGNNVLSLDAMGGRTFGAKMTAPSLVDGTFKLGGANWYEGSIGVTHFFTRSFYAMTEVSMDYFKYGQSQSIGAYLEPDSKSRLTQFQAGVGYAF